MAFIVQYENVIIIAMQDKHNMYYTTQENNQRTTSIPGITLISYPSLYMFNTWGNVTKETGNRRRENRRETRNQMQDSHEMQNAKQLLRITVRI